MKMKNIAIIGECMVELQKKDGQLQQTFGGDTLNTALYLSRLSKGHDINVSYVTALGEDGFSIDMLKLWQEEGIDTQHVLRIKDRNPGIYYIETDETGERNFHYWRNEAAAKFMFEQDESVALIDHLYSFDAIYLSGITLAILTPTGREKLLSLLTEFKQRGGQIFFDNNFRPRLWSSKEEAIQSYANVLALTDTALLTFEDEQELYGDENLEQCIQRTTNAGVRELVIKRGAKDCLVVEGEGANYVAPKPVSKVVDTTAAGDSFSAGFLAKRLTGGSAVDSAFNGHCMAGAVIQHKGAIIPRAEMPEL